MLRSRMFTPGFKLFFGLAAFFLSGAFVLGLSTQLQTDGATVRQNIDSQGIISSFTGPITVGWKGPVGDHLGYTVLVAAGLIAAFLAFVLIAFRDADPDAVAEAAQTETVPLTRAPAGANYLPLLGAFAVGLLIVGWTKNTSILYAGLALLVAVMGTWTVRAWAERSTGDDEVNFQIYHRIIDPLRIPIVGSAAIAFVVLGLSRLILAVPNKEASSFIFGGAGVIFFGGVLAVYLVPKAARTIATVLLVVGALAILGGGIYGIVEGERPVEHHNEGPATGEGEKEAPATGEAPTEHSMAPLTAGAIS